MNKICLISSYLRSNGVEGGVHGTADITMERIPSRNGSPATSRRGRQGGDAGRIDLITILTNLITIP